MGEKNNLLFFFYLRSKKNSIGRRKLMTQKKIKEKLQIKAQISVPLFRKGLGVVPRSIMFP